MPQIKIDFATIKERYPESCDELLLLQKKSRSKHRKLPLADMEWRLEWTEYVDRTIPWNERVVSVFIIGTHDRLSIDAELPEVPAEVWKFYNVTDPTACEKVRDPNATTLQEKWNRQQAALNEEHITLMRAVRGMPHPCLIKTITLELRDGTTETINVPDAPNIRERIVMFGRIPGHE